MIIADFRLFVIKFKGEVYFMNKIFKVVWSQVKGCFVVINEFGKTHQSKSKRIVKKGLYRGVLGACILGIISSSPVFAVTGGE